MSECKHEILELVEEDGDVVWMRCAKCYVLFKLTREEFEKLKPIKNAKELLKNEAEIEF